VGTGVADNKAGVPLRLAAICNALLVLADGLGLGVTVLIDGEEEAGSPNLPLLLQHRSAALRADVVWRTRGTERLGYLPSPPACRG